MDRPLNTRLVRVSAVVVLPPLLAVLFSISTPGTLPRHPLEPLFDTRGAVALAEELSTEFPARVPGTDQSVAAARWFEQSMAAIGLRTEEQVWVEDLAGLGDVELRNVVAIVPGRSDVTIVLVAHRDNHGAAASRGDNASGTAALIELARGFGPQQTAPPPRPARTLVLVSTDAGAYGGAGAAHFARTSPYAQNAFAAVVLDGVGGGGRPRLAIAGDDPSSPARTLVTTAVARITEQTGASPALPSVPAQLVALGIPYAAGEQGPFLANGVAAVTITTREPGEPNVPVGDPGAIAPERYGQLGRTVEALVGSIDGSVGAAFRTPDSLFLDDRVASGWTLRLLLVAAVAPFALGVLDLLARGRRQRIPFAPALRALRARLLLWAFGGILLWIGALAGVLPTGSAHSLSSYAPPVGEWPLAGVALLAVAFGIAWLTGRRRLAPAGRRIASEERLAGYSVALTLLGLVALALALTKPYALLFLLPALYAWLWLPLHSGSWTRALLYALGLSGPVAGILVLGNELALGVLDTLLFVASLATVGYVPVGSVLATIAWAAAAAQLGALAFGRYAAYAGGAEPPPPGVVRTAVARSARSIRRRRYRRAT